MYALKMEIPSGLKNLAPTRQQGHARCSQFRTPAAGAVNMRTGVHRPGMLLGGIKSCIVSLSTHLPALSYEEVGPDVCSRRARQKHCTHVRRSAADSNSVQVQNEAKDEVYPLSKTKVLVETAMLAAVGGLAYLLSSILRMESGLAYFLPLPIVLSAMRGGPMAGFKTMMATFFLLVVLLGPLKAISYLLIHGLLAATMGAMWKVQSGFWMCVLTGTMVRMGATLVYFCLSSLTMNENLFAVMMSNVYAMLDQAVWGVLGARGSPSPVLIGCVLVALVLVNACTFVFLLQVMYKILLQAMGYDIGQLPGFVRKYLYAGIRQPEQATRGT